MEIVIPDPTYDSDSFGNGTFDRQLRAELGNFGEEFELKSADIGRGADWPVALVVFAALFFLGKKINENLDAWLSISKKFKRLVDRLRERFGGCYIDEKGATLLVVERAAGLTTQAIQSIKLVTLAKIALGIIDYNDPGHLPHHPRCCYLISLLINGSLLMTTVVNSTGEFELLYTKNLDDGNPYHEPPLVL